MIDLIRQFWRALRHKPSGPLTAEQIEVIRSAAQILCGHPEFRRDPWHPGERVCVICWRHEPMGLSQAQIEVLRDNADIHNWSPVDISRLQEKMELLDTRAGEPLV